MGKLLLGKKKFPVTEILSQVYAVYSVCYSYHVDQFCRKIHKTYLKNATVSKLSLTSVAGLNIQRETNVDVDAVIIFLGKYMS